MIRKEPINQIQNIIESFSNLPEDDINYGNGHACADAILNKLELLGVILIPMTYKEDPNTGKLIEDGKRWE